MNLETNRLFIRPHTADDFEDYFGYIMEPELQYMLGLNDVHDRASAQETFQWLMENSIFLALVNKETGKTIGHISLQPPVRNCWKIRTSKEKPVILFLSRLQSQCAEKG